MTDLIVHLMQKTMHLMGETATLLGHVLINFSQPHFKRYSYWQNSDEESALDSTDEVTNYLVVAVLHNRLSILLGHK